MLEFVTLFILLVTGPRDVELTVDESRIARVELLLDGEQCALLEKRPWRATCDFGKHLLPHRLEAVGFDAEGSEIVRVSQHVNVCREPAEAMILVDRADDGRPREATVRWTSIAVDELAEIVWSLDGKELARGQSDTVALPRMRLRDVHILEAVLRFGPDDVLRIVEPIGPGTLTKVTDSALTGLSVRARSPSSRIDVEKIGETLSVGEQPLSVRSVELGPARVILIVNPADLAETRRRWHANRGGRTGASARGRAKLGVREAFHLMWPYWESDPARGTNGKLYTWSQPFFHDSGGIDFVLGVVSHPKPMPPESRLSIVDAVAVAGQSVAASGYRRAVVLMLLRDRPSFDDYEIDEARAFLDALGVPLFVWRLPGVAVSPEWGTVTNVGSLRELESAVRELTTDLRSQRIVWVSGRHLPHEVDIARGAPISPVSGGAAVAGR